VGGPYSGGYRAASNSMRHSTIRPFLVSVLSVLLLSAPAALAEGAEATKPSSLSWVELRGAESCGGAVLVAHLVEERLGRHALVAPSQASLSLEGWVEHSEISPSWRAVVVVRDSDGQVLGSREIVSDASTCAELRESVVLAVALMIDPNASSVPAAPMATPRTPEPTIHAAAPDTPCSQAVSKPQPPGRWRVESDAGPELAYGVLPSPAFGISAGLTLALPGLWRARASAAALSPQTLSIGGGASAQLTAAYGGLLVCRAALEDARRQSLELCGGAMLGSLSATGTGFSGNSNGDTNWFVDLVGAASWVLPIAGPLAARLGATVGIAPIRNRVMYDDSTRSRESAYVEPLVNAMADVGVALALP